MISIMHKKILILSYILRVFILNNLTIQNCPLEADTQHGKKKKKMMVCDSLVGDVVYSRSIPINNALLHPEGWYLQILI